MNQTDDPFSKSGSNPVAVVAAVTALSSATVVFLIFAGAAFAGHAEAFVGRGRQTGLLAVLVAGGVAGALAAARFHGAARAHRQLAAGFGVSALTALGALAAKSEAMWMLLAWPAGFSTAWTMVMLSMCLRPTLHSNRLGMWCGLSLGIAYAFCTQPLVFDASSSARIAVAAAVAGLGGAAALRMRGAPARVSSLPDFDFRAAAGWLAALFVMVFLDTLFAYIAQSSVALRQLSWETPLVLLGNAFVQLCVAFIAGLMLDQRRAGLAAVAGLFLMLGACVVLQLGTDDYPKARMLSIGGVAFYSTVFVYLAARSGRIRFSALLFGLSGWIGVGVALGAGMALEERRVPVTVIVPALVVGLAALFARLLWLKRAEQLEAERLVLRRPE